MFQLVVGADHPRIIRLGVEKGLSNNSIRCIYQDRDGFIWFGTFDGLNRYDGYEFKVFRNKQNDSLSLPHNYIYSIHQDQQKKLWVGTGQGLSIYNDLTSNFSPAFFFPYGSKTRQKITANVNQVASDDKGNVFIATNGRGLMVQRAGANTAIQIPVKGGTIQGVEYGVDVEIDQQQRVWLFVSGAGLCRYNYGTQQVELVSSAIKFANTFVSDSEDHLWVGSANGLHQFSITGMGYVKTYSAEQGKLSSNNIASLSFDKERNLWIGTEGAGVNILNPATGQLTYILPGEDSRSLSSESVTVIYHDNESRHWMGTLKGGLNIIDPQISQFRTIAHDPLNSNSLVNNFAACFFEDGGGNLYIGTDGGGMSIWNRKTNQFEHFRHNAANPHSLSSNMVTSILEDNRQQVWVATFGGGINKFNKRSGQFEHYRCVNDSTGIENRNVWKLCMDHENTLWATSFGSGKLYRYDEKANRFEVFGQVLYDLISILEDRNGVLWAGNSHQLIRIDRQNKKHQYFEIGKPVRAIYEDKQGNCWLGTEGGGIVLFDRAGGKVIARYGDADGLCNNSVLNISENGRGDLWLSTFNGLSCFNATQKKFTNYYQSDGLPSNQFIYSAALRLRSGELVFGSINGFVLFDPGNIAPRNFMPPVLITGLRVNNRLVSDEDGYINGISDHHISSLHIPYNKAVVSVDFAALEYSSPGKIRYGYFLDGWDKDWNYTSKIRTANYTNLREGSYTLYIKSTNAAGVWNTRQTIIQITVLPPWYRTWWAFLLYACIGIGVLYLYLTYKARQTRLEYQVQIARLNGDNERAEREKSEALLGLEKAERQRSETELELAKAEKEKGEAELEAQRVINEKERELNHKKEAFFTNISHEFRTPLTLVLNPIKDLIKNKEGGTNTADLRLIYQNAGRMLRLVDQLLLFQKADSELDRLKISKIDLTALTKEVYNSFTQVAKAKKIEYQLFLDDEEELVIYADREKLEVIFYNLLSNAFKYTPNEGKVWFHVTVEEGCVRIEIRDSGPGIPRHAREKLFERFYQANTAKAGFGIGLFLVKHFVQAHKGVIDYTTEAGVGTAFFVQLPLGVEHLAGQEIVEERVESNAIIEELPEATAGEEDDEELQQAHTPLTTESRSILVVDDNAEIRQYIRQLFKGQFSVYEAQSGEEALTMAHQYQPDIIISDVVMQEMTGIELCQRIKGDSALGHIPVILVTGNASTEARLRGVEGGADDYISKPFEKDLLIARVAALLRSRNNLQKYFYNEITFQHNPYKISTDYKEFLDNCIGIVEAHLDDDQFSIVTLARELGMSYSKMNKKIKAVSGQPANAFVRFIRLRKAAELFINTNYNISETAFMVGISDIKHFRKHFTSLFGMKPSAYIEKYRRYMGKQYQLNEKVVKRDEPAR
ncbi:two-component regulator propeller domain-containing protein [Paraflavitalea soli]|uniref:two-component regulator propeller domain-containing protein n=1 Tax=Paraflavitalea soli TaxID=2315862 RepID=UPI0013C4D79C|nr:two-component regulator propeller domain-containing protein [Paraflavitalea soli]